MPTEPAPTLLMVRRLADLERASTEVAAFLAIRRRRSMRAAPLDIRGIWLGEDGATNPPAELFLSDTTVTRRTVHVRETTGSGGIWMLCWLEAAAHTVSRVDLVAALLRSPAHGATRNDAPAARFVPVFANTTPERALRAEMELLRTHYPALVLPAARFDGHCRLTPPPVHSPGALRPALRGQWH